MFSVSASICSSVKGNPSKDGTKLVVRATNGRGELVAFTCDISAQRKYPDIKLTNLSGRNGYCTISPSGRYLENRHSIPDTSC